MRLTPQRVLAVLMLFVSRCSTSWNWYGTISIVPVPANFLRKSIAARAYYDDSALEKDITSLCNVVKSQQRLTIALRDTLDRNLELTSETFRLETFRLA